MRRWLLVFMLLLYPFQLALAMADQCCVATPAGITHHTGQGEGEGAAAGAPVFLADDAASSLADPHCPACVFGQISGVPPHAAPMASIRHGEAAAPSSIFLLPSVPRSRPERPNWPASAR